MTTTQKKTTARDKLLESAMNLMLARGYNATAVDEICADAGVSKGSFYHFFKSKEELGLAALELYYKLGMAMWLSGPFMTEPDPMKKLMGFLLKTEETSVEKWRHGCLLGTFAIDLANTDSIIRKKVEQQFDEILDVLADFFEPVAQSGTTTGREMAAGYISTLEGGIVMSKAFGDPGRIRESLRQFRVQLEATLN